MVDVVARVGKKATGSTLLAFDRAGDLSEDQLRGALMEVTFVEEEREEREKGEEGEEEEGAGDEANEAGGGMTMLHDGGLIKMEGESSENGD